MSCEGNSPSNCYDKDEVCTATSIGESRVICQDNSEYICHRADEHSWLEEDLLSFYSLKRHNFTQCEQDRHFVCKDRGKCIHSSLVCDGYEQCDDGSDEGWDRCGKCPR